MYEKFEELLKENRTNSSQVAKATGINRSTFSKWKKTGSTPNASTLIKIAEHFGVGLDYFYLDDAIAEHNDSIDGDFVELTEEEKKMLVNKLTMAVYEKFGSKDFSDGQIDTIIKVIDAVAGEDNGNEHND